MVKFSNNDNGEIMDTEFELIGGPFDGKKLNRDEESKDGLTIAFPRMVEKKEEEFELCFYKRKNKESLVFKFVSSKFIREDDSE